MSLEVEGEVAQRIDPDEADRFIISEEVRRHAEDRTLIVVRSSEHHSARFAWGVPLLRDLVASVSELFVSLGALDPVESFVVAVDDTDLEVGETASLELTPVVFRGPVDSLGGDTTGGVLLYFLTDDVDSQLRRGIERMFPDSRRSA